MIRRTPFSLFQLELNYVTNALTSNGYPKSLIQDAIKKSENSIIVTPEPEELVGIFFKMVEPREKTSYAVLPYIKGLTENITRTLHTHDIRVTNKPLTTLQQLFPSPKFRPTVEEQTNVVYRIPCADCKWSYIGETGRSFLTRKKEHERNIKNFARGSNVANHAWKHDHNIDIKNASIIDKDTVEFGRH